MKRESVKKIDKALKSIEATLAEEMHGLVDKGLTQKAASLLSRISSARLSWRWLQEAAVEKASS